MTTRTFNVDKAFGVPDFSAILFSGGIDSTTALFMALAMHKQDSNKVHAISFNYGQRHSKELTAASDICKHWSIEQHTIDLSNIIPESTMLRDTESDIPDVNYSELKGVSPTYVPFRNGLMITAAASYVVGLLDSGIESGIYEEDAVAHIYAGMHEGDAVNFAYPDCTPEFAGSMSNAIWLGTYGRVRFVAPLIHMSKHRIVELGDELGAPLSDTWSCYRGDDIHCGVCPTCRARKEAFIDACVDDSTEYAN
jgi:7-cyano-7-deazaguanine synthase